jgi:ribosomal-protein-alanine N-acetyltransferase
MSYLTLAELHNNLVNKQPGNNLQTLDIYFEKLNLTGLIEMHEYSINEDFYEYFEFDAFKTIDETKAYLEKLISRMSKEGEYNQAMYWFIRRKSDNKLLGTAGLVNLNFTRKSIEWGYGIDPLFWGEGYILQVQEALKYYVFEELHLNRLEGITMINNERTIASLLNCGMKKEGVLRDYYCKSGVFIDGWKYSMLKREFLDLNIPQLPNNNFKIEQKEIIKILSDILNEDVNENTTMYNTASWDSINHMNFVIQLYEKFNIKLTPIQISNATSVNSILILINNLQN